MKIPKFAKLKFDTEAERRARAPVDQWRLEFPHLSRAYDAAISFGRGGRIEPGDFERIARDHPKRRGKGRGENRDALARSPTEGGRFVDGGEDDWSDHQSATASDDLTSDGTALVEDALYGHEDDSEQEHDREDDPYAFSRSSRLDDPEEESRYDYDDDY